MGASSLKPIMFTAWESFVSGRSSSGIVAVTIINHCWEHRFFFEAFSIITAWEKVVSGRLLCKDRCRNVFRYNNEYMPICAVLFALFHFCLREI